MKEKLGLSLAGLFACGWILFFASLVYRNVWGPAQPKPLPLAAANPRVAGATIPAAEATHLQDDELIIGTLIAGQPRAYPISYLQLGEHLNDQLDGIPILVTW